MKRETNYSKYILVVNLLILLVLSFLLAFIFYLIYQFIELKIWVEKSYENLDIKNNITKLAPYCYESVIDRISKLVDTENVENIKNFFQDMFSNTKNINVENIMNSLSERIVSITEEQKKNIRDILNDLIE